VAALGQAEADRADVLRHAAGLGLEGLEHA
jgi:hypothetical protein